MIYLYPHQLLYLHKRVIETSGGSQGVRDQGLMESAVYRPQASFGGADLYPDVFAKAAALGHSILRNHPFVDGNKRTGFESMRLCLRMNGFDVVATQDAKYAFTMRIAQDHAFDEHAIAQWLRKNSRKRT